MKILIVILALILIFNAEAYCADLYNKPQLRTPLLFGKDIDKKEKIASGETITRSRRDFFRYVAGTAALGQFISRIGHKPPEVSIESLLKDTGNRPEIPYLAGNYYSFYGDVFSPDGRYLGLIEASAPQKIIDITSGKILGCYNWYMLSPRERWIYDITGRRINIFVDTTKLFSAGKDVYRMPIYIKRPHNRLLKAGYLVTEPDVRGAVGTHIEDIRGKKIATIEPTVLACSYEGEDSVRKIHAILDTSSLTHYFFIEPATEKLYKELREAVDNFNPSDIKGRILKIELVRRLMEIEIELGLRPDIIMTRQEALEAYNRLNTKSLEELNNLRDPFIQETLWGAMANAHPQFRLYYESVKALGFDKDPEVLYESLKGLTAGFKNAASNDLNQRIYSGDSFGKDNIFKNELIKIFLAAYYFSIHYLRQERLSHI